MNEHVVVSSWLGTDDSFLTLGILLPVSPHRIGDNRRKIIGLLLACRVEEDAHRSSNPSVNGCDRSNIVSSTSFSRSRFPMADESSIDGTPFCLVTATTRDEVFDLAFDYLLAF